MEMFCPQGGKAEPQPLSVWCAQRLPSNEDSVCACVCGGARGLEQLRSGEAWQKQAQPGLKVNIDSDKLS